LGDEWLACGAVLVASLMQLQWPPLCCAVLVASLAVSLLRSMGAERSSNVKLRARMTLASAARY